MNFSLLFGLCVINLIHGKYLLVDVDDTQNTPIEPNGNRCAWPPCYPPPRIDVEDTQNPQKEANENRCRYPPCRPSAPMKDSKCFPPWRCIGLRRYEGKNISVLRKEHKIPSVKDDF